MLKKGLMILSIIATLCLMLDYYLLQNGKIRYLVNGKSSHLYNEYKLVVYVIGKAAIGDYLWQHIMEGTLDDGANGFYRTGEIDVDEFTFKYLAGPGYIQSTIPQNIEYLVLVLNGRSAGKIAAALQWLNNLHILTKLKKLAVVLLGDERCLNDWILKYMKKQGGIIDVLFVVYDWKYVDNVDIFQWPLGVATYRGFPLISEANLNHLPRHHVCNFMGTVYANSSRLALIRIITGNHFRFDCVTTARDRWLASETKETLHHYIRVLNNSDFTLCPVGKNTECYRIYEALSSGSVPIVEDVMTEGNCSSPLRLLKEYKAPVLFVKNWEQVNFVLKRFTNNPEQIFLLRHENIVWYQKFRQDMRRKFVEMLKKKFLQ